MPWLIAFLVAHSVEIAAIAGGLALVNEVGNTVITAEKIIEMKKDKNND